MFTILISEMKTQSHKIVIECTFAKGPDLGVKRLGPWTPAAVYAREGKICEICCSENCVVLHLPHPFQEGITFPLT